MGVFVALTLLALAGMLIAAGLNSRLGVWVLKPLASAGFIAAALAAGAPGSAYGRSVLVALALSWCGDVLLIPRSQGFFRAGLASFLLAHLAYACAFAVRGLSVAWVAGASAVLAALGAVVGRWLLGIVPAGLRIPVLAYLVAISAMVALAAGTAGAGGRPAILGAAIAFYFSDLAVARDRFAGAGFRNRLVGLLLYYGAQIVFAATTAR